MKVIAQLETAAGPRDRAVNVTKKVNRAYMRAKREHGELGGDTNPQAVAVRNKIQERMEVFLAVEKALHGNDIDLDLYL